MLSRFFKKKKAPAKKIPAKKNAKKPAAPKKSAPKSVKSVKPAPKAAPLPEKKEIYVPQPPLPTIKPGRLITAEGWKQLMMHRFSKK
ncbi:MAG: hypothetical protein RLZZ453_1259 [Chlamydiota bacterium]|jgi:hypothetical protein